MFLEIGGGGHKIGSAGGELMGGGVWPGSSGLGHRRDYGRFAGWERKSARGLAQSKTLRAYVGIHEDSRLAFRSVFGEISAGTESPPSDIANEIPLVDCARATGSCRV